MQHAGFSLVVVCGLSCPVAGGILVPQPGVKHWKHVSNIGRQILNHWTTREVSQNAFNEKLAFFPLSFPVSPSSSPPSPSHPSSFWLVLPSCISPLPLPRLTVSAVLANATLPLQGVDHFSASTRPCNLSTHLASSRYSTGMRGQECWRTEAKDWGQGLEGCLEPFLGGGLRDASVSFPDSLLVEGQLEGGPLLSPVSSPLSLCLSPLAMSKETARPASASPLSLGCS